MTKLVLSDITNPSDQNSLAATVNANNNAIETAMENTLSRDGTYPNQMGAAIDMNSHRVLNLPQPLSVNEPLRLKDLNSFVGGGTISTIPAGGLAGMVLFKQSSADYDAVWANAAGTVTSVGLTGSADFTITGSPITGSGTFNISHTSTSGTGAMVRATNPVIITPTISQINSTATVGFFNSGNAQGINVEDICVTSSYNKTPPTNGIWTDGGVAFAGGTSGSVLVQATSGAASGTLTLPSITGTLVADNAAQTLTNKTLTSPTINTPTMTINDGSFTLQNTADNTKKVVFSVAGIGAGTTRTISFANATDTVTMNATTQTLTNKTINGSNNTITNVSLATGVTGNLPVTNLNSGTGASSSTFWRGDGTWATPAGAGTVTSVSANGVTITSSGTIPGEYGLANHGLSISAAAGALTINLTDAAGATPTATSPVYGNFYNPNIGNGTWSALTVSSALSLVLPSSSTLGVASSTAFRLWVVLFNDAGTARLGAINCRVGATGASQTIFPLIESQVASSTAVSAAATSAGVYYTGTAVTSKSFLIVGYLEWNASGITAGTWTTTNQTYIRSFGAGVRKPGEPVGNLQSIFLGSGSSGATSMADVTGATLTMTPSSPANIFKVQATASCVVSAGGSGTNSTYTGQLLRGATVISNFAMGVVSGAGTNQQSQGAAAWHAIDFPNTSSNSTYKLQHSATGGTSTAQTYNVCMSVEEIMT